MTRILNKEPDKIKLLFSNKDFTLEKEEHFSSFGDSLLQFVKAQLGVRVLSDKGVEYVEAATLDEPENWYDLGLLKAMILNSDDTLLEPPRLELDLAFLFDNLDEIERSFDETNLADTKARLKNLKAIRAHRMFPEWY